MDPPLTSTNGEPPLRFDTIEDSIEAFRTETPLPYVSSPISQIISPSSPFLTFALLTLLPFPPMIGNNEFIIVLDSPHRENEGDLVIAAEAITAPQMAFMVRHTSGLICTPMPATLCTHLSLPQMVQKNADPKSTAYTLSVDADSADLTTGISAHDRALTCRTLAGRDATERSVRRPGHVFPLRAREGGIRERRGHTEAAVEFCRLAGKRPVGVIGELVEEGQEVSGRAVRVEREGMMRRDECLRFGRRWGLRVCTIEDLVDYVEEREEGQEA